MLSNVKNLCPTYRAVSSSLVEKLTQIDEQSDIVQHAYDAIAESFIFNNKPSTNNDRTSLLDHWICYNCNNRNFSSYVNSKLNIALVVKSDWIYSNEYFNITDACGVYKTFNVQ